MRGLDFSAAKATRVSRAEKNISECSLKHLSNPPIYGYPQKTEGGAGEMFRVCSDIYRVDFSSAI